jgi:3-hydroxyisobutyrate dehydrogenase
VDNPCRGDRRGDGRGQRVGLEPDVWWRTIHARRPTAFVLRHDVPSIFAGHYDPSFPIALYLKDLSLVDELTVETEVRNELTRATLERFKEAGARYGAGAWEMTLCEVIEAAAGISLRVADDRVNPWEMRHPNER